MAQSVMVICRFGGTFRHHENKYMYIGGEAYAMEVNDEMSIDFFISQVAAKCGFHVESSPFMLKYHMPGNEAVLLTLINDVDLKNFIKMYINSLPTDIFIIHQDGDSGGNRNMTLQTHVRDDQANLEHEARMLSLWRDVIVEEGQMFDGAYEFRESLRKYAIAHHFAYKFVKNDKRRVTAICKEENCRWRIHAINMENTNVFYIKTFERSHSCDPGIGQKTHPQASKKLVASMVQEKLRDTQGILLMIFAVIMEFLYVFQQAYRGKEIARQDIHGSLEDSFSQIPWLCSKILETNLGSHVVWETAQNNRFQQLFISFHAQIVGFKSACRPLLLIDGTFGKEHYKVTILSAIAIDANNQMYPLAFGIVLGETRQNWLWFLSNLKIILEGVAELTFISDGHPGLVDTVVEVFPNFYHAVCVHHLVATHSTRQDKTVDFFLEIEFGVEEVPKYYTTALGESKESQ